MKKFLSVVCLMSLSSASFAGYVCESQGQALMVVEFDRAQSAKVDLHDGKEIITFAGHVVQSNDPFYHVTNISMSDGKGQAADLQISEHTIMTRGGSCRGPICGGDSTLKRVSAKLSYLGHEVLFSCK
jgi:hypothetical protein